MSNIWDTVLAIVIIIFSLVLLYMKDLSYGDFLIISSILLVGREVYRIGVKK